jgi:hypothetical protein
VSALRFYRFSGYRYVAVKILFAYEQHAIAVKLLHTRRHSLQRFPSASRRNAIGTLKTNFHLMRMRGRIWLLALETIVFLQTLGASRVSRLHFQLA